MIVSDVRNRFLQKPKAVFDMNWLLAGRKISEKDLTPLRVTYEYRTGFFGGKVNYNEGSTIPKESIIRTTTTYNPEGLEIIPPIIRGTPGWVLFSEKPFAQLALLRQEITELQMKLAVKATTLTEVKDFTQLKNIVNEVVDMFGTVRRKIETIQNEQAGNLTTFQQPMIPGRNEERRM